MCRKQWRTIVKTNVQIIRRDEHRRVRTKNLYIRSIHNNNFLDDFGWSNTKPFDYFGFRRKVPFCRGHHSFI